MAGDLRLRTAKYLHKIANAYLLIAHKVQESEPGIVSKRLKKPLPVECFLCHHVFYVYALTYSSASNIVA